MSNFAVGRKSRPPGMSAPAAAFPETNHRPARFQQAVARRAPLLLPKLVRLAGPPHTPVNGVNGNETGGRPDGYLMTQ
jgi:hypothetical protein